jgi:hypothetical protein
MTISTILRRLARLRERPLAQFKMLQIEKILIGGLRGLLDQILGVQRSVQAIKKREYKNLLEGRFKMTQVVKIERKDNIYNISNKWADFTSKTIDKMKKQGEDDAWKVQI